MRAWAVLRYSETAAHPGRAEEEAGGRGGMTWAAGDEACGQLAPNGSAVLRQGVGDQREGDMTEAEWLECKAPDPMIRFLELGRKTTCRKLRLFGVACCRRMGRFLSDERIQKVVEAAEGYADGLIDATRLRTAHRRSSTLCKKLEIIPGDRAACVLSNAAIAADWVSVSDAWFRTDGPIKSSNPEIGRAHV